MSAGVASFSLLSLHPKKRCTQRVKKKIHAMVRTYGFSMFLEPSLTLF